MRNIILNGKRMITKEKTHAYLKRKLKLAPYYGKNFDALFDLLTESCELTVITLIHHEVMLSKLGLYGESLLQVFKDAEEENRHMIFILP